MRDDVDAARARYLAGEGEDHEYGTADEENPELTEEDFLWMVDVRAFPSDRAAHDFNVARWEFLKAAEAAGIPRETFLPFEPNKPGFMDRAREAFTAFPRKMGWAAE